MAPFKEERGASPKVTRRMLYSLSYTTFDGYVITNQVINEITIVPPYRKDVHPVDKGDGRGGDRRQTELPWYSGLEDPPPTAEEAQSAQEDGHVRWQSAEHRESFGCRQIDSMALDRARVSEPPPGSKTESNDSSRQFREEPEAPTPTFFQWSKTTKSISPSSPEALSRITSSPPTGSDVSSAKSSSGSTKLPKKGKARK